MSRTMIGIILLSCFQARPSAGQPAQTLVEGQRLRVSHRCSIALDRWTICRDDQSPTVTTGYLIGLDSGAVHIRTTEGREYAVPMHAVTQVWAVDGKKGNSGKGAMVGMLAGTVFGLAAGSRGGEFCGLWGSGGECVSLAGLGAMVGAPVGLMLGAIIGAFVRTERWRPVLVDHVQVGLRRGVDAKTLTVSVGF